MLKDGVYTCENGPTLKVSQMGWYLNLQDDYQDFVKDDMWFFRVEKEKPTDFIYPVEFLLVKER